MAKNSIVQKIETPHHWLMKSEPSVYGISDLSRDRHTLWEGVRNYQARNFMRAMSVGDRVLLYHSNADVVGIVGVARVRSAAKADPTQFDARSEYFDAGAKKDDPRWSAVEVEFESKFAVAVTLDDLRGDHALASMMILRKGNRLSVTPVTADEFAAVMKLARSVAKSE
ncbi:MAG: EVE domain-containing protein [Planctomycetota bacterium]|nr:EVE domain-containing protein [Planctomycetota bacterium]